MRTAGRKTGRRRSGIGFIIIWSFQFFNDMRMLDLFCGIGGFSLAASWVWGDELEIAGFCEIDDYCGKVLNKNFPGVPVYKDITQLDGTQFKNIDLITGGFPCPAFSVAGKRGGFKQDDLFFEMIRICDECRPTAIIFENVQGFTKWREPLHKEVETIGYEWGDAILDARDFGVPQSRRRYFAFCVQRGVLSSPQYLRRIQGKENSRVYGTQPNNKNTKGRWSSTIKTKEEWRNIYRNSRRIRNNNGVSAGLDRYRKFGLGNAIVPQCSALIMDRIKELI